VPFHCSECGKVLVPVAGEMCGSCKAKKAKESRAKVQQAHEKGPQEAVSPQEKCKGDLIVEITRKDEKAFSDHVGIKIVSKATKTADTQKSENIETHTFSGIEPGEYEISITPKNKEKDWRIISANPESDDVKVTVTKGGVSTAKFVIAPAYKWIQFIGCELPTGAGEKKGTPYYLGKKDAQADIKKRCKIMKNAVVTAYNKASDVEKDDPEVLKIFMAPEFYFRGAEGAYPINEVSMAMENLRKETESDERDYSDWLFIFGTVIGYQKHEATISKVVDIEKDPTDKTILTVDHVSRGIEIDSSVKQTHGPSAGKVTDVSEITYQDDKGKDKKGFKITLDTDAGFNKGDIIDLTRPKGHTEILNIALVQKGGKENSVSSNGQRGLRQALIYKEYISSVDFLGKDFGKGDFYANRQIDIHGDKNRTVLPTEGSQDDLSIKENRPGDTYKWTGKKRGEDKEREHTERISEINKSGIGGGSVFTMDDITFGLEVCLDHQRISLGKGKWTGRLKDYYDNHAVAGEPKVQVQLIPSCGMSIKKDAICCVNDGLIFNVDGAGKDGWSNAKVNTGGSGTFINKLSEKKLNLSGKDWWTITHKNYFQKRGLIRVYEKKRIPDKEVE